MFSSSSSSSSSPSDNVIDPGIDYVLPPRFYYTIVVLVTGAGVGAGCRVQTTCKTGQVCEEVHGYRLPARGRGEYEFHRPVSDSKHTAAHSAVSKAGGFCCIHADKLRHCTKHNFRQPNGPLLRETWTNEPTTLWNVSGHYSSVLH